MAMAMAMRWRCDGAEVDERPTPFRPELDIAPPFSDVFGRYADAPRVNGLCMSHARAGFLTKVFMSWKLVFGLSLLGLAMGGATVFVIPQRIEPGLWLAIFAVSAVMIAKRAPGRYFLHGLLVSQANSFWVTVAHVALFANYAVGHGDVIAMAARGGDPRAMMALAGAAAGIVGGVFLGLMAWASSKFVVSAQSEFAGW